MSEWTRPAQPVRCVVELDKPLAVHRERGVLAQGDANANAIVAEVYSTAGKPYDLSGCTVQLIFVRPDNNALQAINAEISGNTATATLPDSAYAMSGMYSLRMQLRKNGAERTIVWIIGEVKGTDVDGIADPEHVISIGDIMASAKEAQAAASAANTAAERANAGAERAEQLQIDASGLAGDSNKLDGKPPSYYLPVVQLLDNAYWKYHEKIIDQRGIKSEDVIPTWAYFFDRWKSRSGQLTVTFDDNDGVIVNGLDGYFYQITERKYSGESYTTAVAFADGEILVCSGNDQSYAGSPILLATAGNVTGERVHIYRDTAERLETIFYTGNRRVLWLLLTPGTYTAATLPLVVPRPYAVELAECQKRYVRFIGWSGLVLAHSVCTWGDYVAFIFPISMAGGNEFSSNFSNLKIRTGAGYYTVDSIENCSFADNYFSVYVKATGVPAGAPCELYFDGDGFLEISKDL